MAKGFCWLVLLGVALSLAGAPSGAEAQTTTDARIQELLSLAERDNDTALEKLVALGASLTAQTPYLLRRDYLIALATLQVDGARMASAQATNTELMALAKANQDDVGLIIATAREASILDRSGKAEAAIVKLKAVESVALRAANAEAAWRFYLSLGGAYLTVGKFELALDSTLKSLQFAVERNHGAQVSHLRSLNLLVAVYMGMTNWEKGLQVSQEALDLAQLVGSAKMQGTLHLNQGVILAHLDKPKAAIDAYTKALQTGQKSGLVGLQGNALNNIADSYLVAKNYPQAEYSARQALIKFREADELDGVAAARVNIGFALMGQGRLDTGVAEVRQSLRFYQEAGAKSDQEAILGELGRMYEQIGMYREAIVAIREQQTLSAELFRADREKSVATLQEQFDTAQRQKQIELLARENSLKDAEISNQRLQQIATLLGTLVALMGGFFVFFLYRRVRKANQKLREANLQLEFHSVRDPLTGLFNRRSFLELMGRRSTEATSDRRGDDFPDGLMILDVDFFKHINDTLGHVGGDVVLVEIASRLRAAVRDTDMVMRWGGEEFLIFSPKAPPDQLKILAQRVLRVIGERPIAVGEKSMTVTVTGGFLTLPFSGLSEADCNWEKAMQIADMALYLGKVNGRNRAYGLTRLLVPFEQVMPVLERDISAALKGGMVDLVEVIGPETGRLS